MHTLLRTATSVAFVVAASVQASAQQQSAARQQQQIDSLITAMRELQAHLDSLAQVSARPVQAAPQSGSYMNVGFSGLMDAGWSTEKNVQALQVGDHDPHVRGFTIPNAELTLDGAIDPFFKGFVNIVHKLDANGETGVELEEMYVVSSSLPGNLQLKAGQYFAEFGRQNSQHPHAWSFVDQPLVLNRMFGAEGLRSQGARISWLAPTSTYVEAMVSVLNSAGGTTSSFRSDESSDIHGGVAIDRPVRGGGDMLYVPRIATSFEPTSTQTVVVGASGAFGPNNAGTETKTQIVGGDIYWKWKSARAHQGFPFVSVQTEAMMRHYDVAARASAADAAVTLPAETLKDNGAYAQLLWGIKPMITAGFRGEFVNGDAAAFSVEGRNDRTRFSPNLTWYPSEFSKIRFQYNYDDRKGIGTDHSLWVQFEFTLGAHAAHKF